MGKSGNMSFNGRKLAGAYGQNIYVYEKTLVPGDCLPMPRGYIPVTYFNIQTPFLKPPGQSKPNFTWNILRTWKRKFINIKKWSRSHDQDGRHGYEYLKPLKILVSRTRRPMILKLGMKHQRKELYKVYINHDPGMTLTYFPAISTMSLKRFNGGGL